MNLSEAVAQPTPAGFSLRRDSRLVIASPDDLRRSSRVVPPAGLLNAVLDGKNGGAGIGIVEVYNLK
jgi:hypothetical protein